MPTPALLILLLASCQTRTAPTDLAIQITASRAELTADGRSAADLVLTATSGGEPVEDGTEIPLTTSLGALTIEPASGGEARATLRAGTWPGEATFAAEGWEISGDAGVDLVWGEPVGTQLHVHGSLSEGNASMRYHTEQAELYGTDLLWWTDHDHFYHRDREGEFSGFDFEGGDTAMASPIYYDSTATARWDLREQEVTDYTASVEPAAAYQSDYGWRLSIEDQPEGARLLHVLEVNPRVNFKPLMAELSFSVWIRPMGEPGLIIRIPLSASHVSRTEREEGYNQIVLYHLDSPPPSEENAHYIAIDAPDGEWTEVTLDVSEVARSAFPDLGVDQHAEMIDIELLGAPGEVVAYDVDELSWPQELVGAELMAVQRDYLAGLGGPVEHLVGHEISGFGVDHLNAFGEGVELLRYSEIGPDWGLAETAAHVQAGGGLISYNHMFTTAGSLFDEAEVAQRVAERTEELLSTEAYGCDLIEVGYRKRGGEIGDFMEVWDALSAAGIWLTGTGVGDVHNQIDLAELDNNFVTWVSSASSAEEDLLWNLGRGAAWFGDPTLFPTGEVAVALTAPAIQTTIGQVAADVDGPVDVRFSADWLGANWLVRAIGDNEALGSWTTNQDGAFEASVTVDPSQHSAVRFEALSEDGSPALYTNPLHLLPPGDARADGIPADRLPAP